MAETTEHRHPAWLRGLPNAMTWGRIALILPVALLLLLGEGGGARGLAFALFALAAVTDWLDGYLARKLDVVSPVGRVFDPIADKLLAAVVLVLLAGDGTLSLLGCLAAAAILSREILVSGLREALGPQGVVLPVSLLAKWKTTAQLVALGVLILAPALAASLPWIGLAGHALLYLAALLTWITGAQYCGAALRVLRAVEETDDTGES